MLQRLPSPSARTGWLLVLALVLSAPLPLRASPETGTVPHTVRVRLFELNQPVAVSIAARDGAVRLFAGDYPDPIARLDPGQEAALSVANGQVHVRLPEQGLFATSIRIVAAAGATVEAGVVDGRTRARPNRYPGTLTVDVDVDAGAVLRLVNEVGLEEYVAAVVSREYGFDDREGAKAMAVLVRTYTLANVGKYGPDYDLVDHVGSQVYQGIDRLTPTFVEAARQTEGEVLTYRGELIEAVYFSSSGGHTASNETVWQGAAQPYLRGRPDPYDSASPHQSWRSEVSRPRLLDLLTRTYGFTVEGFHLGERGADGRVQTIDLLKPGGARHTIRAHDFRMLILRHFGADALRSTNFTARRVGDTYAFEGRGNGHGVGLSQWGARELSRLGRTYREILDYYYAGVTLTHLDLAAAPAPPVTPVVTQDVEPLPTSRGRIGW